MTILDEHELVIDGVVMPRTKSLSIQYNLLWVTGTGRMSNGDFNGFIQNVKWRIDAVWGPVSEDDMKLIISTVYNGKPFHDIRFKNPMTKKFETRKMYVGDLKSDVYNYAIPDAMYQSLPLSFVEQ